MGAKKSLTRAVLDTNVLISVLLFGGRLEPIRHAWRKGLLRIVASRELVDELVRALAYPRFRLTGKEISGLLRSEILPYVEVIEVPSDAGSWCRDPDDDKFIRCAIAGRCSYLVSGDKALLELRKVEGVGIVTPSEFIRLAVD